MSKEIYISSTPHETRLAIVENDALAEIYYERENEYTLAGSIYNGRVTRVLPGMQSSFVDIGLERDAFLYITDFMEEAGDTADFEASANSGDSSRPKNDRNGRDQADREAQARPAEPTDSDLFAQAVNGLDPSRPVGEGERSERGDRGRRGGRNRGNRGGNRDARPDETRIPPPQPEPIQAATPIAGNISIPDSRDEVGEGLPGADGSRRWRGRRGRRGNRGPRPDSAAPLPQNTQAPASIQADYAPQSADFEAEDGEMEDPLLAAAETLPTASEQADFRERISSGDPGSDRSESGGRGGRPNRNERGGRNRGSAGAPRAPRGFAPSTSLYQVDKTEEDNNAYGVEPEIERPLEPMILPGESLARYRPGSETPAEVSRVVAAPPVSDFVAEGWDGGLVLPGETLRPRTGSPAPYRNDTPRDARGREARDGRGDRGRGRQDRGRDERGPRQPESDLIQPAVSGSYTPAFAESTPLETTHSESTHAELTPAAPSVDIPTYLTEPEHVPSSHLITPVDSTFVPPPPRPGAAEELADAPEMIDTPVAPVEALGAAEPALETRELLPEIEAPAQEYEPQQASASYRVDPVAPREFRQAAPILEVEELPLDEPAAQKDHLGAEQHAAGQDTAAAPQMSEVSSQAAEPELFAPSSEPEFIPAVDLPAEFIHEPGQEAFEGQAGEHEMTVVSDMGDMHSEPAAVGERELPAHAHHEASSPIAHESVVADGIVSAPVPVAPIAAYFEPGSGFLEEEVLDDEDEPVMLHAVEAHSAADFEQQEQETLEHAADLGTMIRDMSIDQQTRIQPVLDDEDDEDFEEDFLEEDQDFDPEEEEAGDEHEAVYAGDNLGFGEPGNEAELENGEMGEPGGAFEDAPGAAVVDESDSARTVGDQTRREGRGDRGRGRDARRDGRANRSGDRRPNSNDRSHSQGSSDRGRHNGHGRQTMQATNLPAISDLLKPGQEILVQIAKEPIAKKGARITSHIALPGRFLVFMPTVSHTGVSRKIESDGERRRLKEILLSERGEAQGGFIVRTAAAGASEEELRSDLRFLLNLWADIKTRSESSKSPALIYHDLNLIERVLRDQVTDTFSAIWVDTETEYERVLRFLQRFQPSLIRRVKLYTKETPLFEQFGITEEINKALRSKVWLKSGGSIVINQTEALVAIDINTGKYVGKTARLEDTIVKTNLDAIPEIVRQIRLRDLGGIIIIDFIDMDERKNRNKVMMALEDELKLDRAPSKVLQFNDFGLVAITRKRVKQSLERTLSTTCGICAGTGMVKSPVTVCNDIYVEMRKMVKHLDRGDVMLRVHPDVVKQLKAPSTHWLQEMEEMCGKTILIKSDPSLHPEQFDIH